MEVEERKRKRKKKQPSKIVGGAEDLTQEQTELDFHVGEKSDRVLDNQPKKKKKKKIRSRETSPGVSVAVNTPVDQAGEKKKKKKKLGNICEIPEDLIQKHTTKQKALDTRVGEKSDGYLDDQPKKKKKEKEAGRLDNQPNKKKKKAKEAATQETSPGVSIAVNTPVDQVGERKRKKKKLGNICEIPGVFIPKHPTKQKALDTNVGEKSDGGLDNQPKKKKKKEKEAVFHETSPGVAIAVNTPVDQVGESKRKKEKLGNICEIPGNLIPKHATKQKALDINVGEKSDGGLDNRPKKKKKKEKEAVSHETSPAVSIAVNTPVDQVWKRKRKKKKLGNMCEIPEDLIQKHPTKRRASDFNVGEEPVGGLDTRPQKKKRKEKKAVAQEAIPGVCIAINTPFDQKMKQEAALTTPVDQRMKPETALATPEATLPFSSDRGGTGTGSIQPTVGQMFKHQLTAAGSILLKGKTLDEILEKLSRAIESEKGTKGQVRDNIWLKQKFSVGINEVTRTLERMPTALDKANMNDVSTIKHLKNVQGTLQCFPASQDSHLEDKGPDKQIARSLRNPERVVQLQAVLVAKDCRPGEVTSHISPLASSRGVPLFSVSDHGNGSLRLGQLLMLRTTTTIGIKVGESLINKTIQDILDHQPASVHKNSL